MGWMGSNPTAFTLYPHQLVLGEQLRGQYAVVSWEGPLQACQQLPRLRGQQALPHLPQHGQQLRLILQHTKHR